MLHALLSFQAKFASANTHTGYVNHYCLSNRLCFDPFELFFYRGSCSSTSWDNRVCGDICLEYDNRPSSVEQCTNNTVNGKTSWVCGGEDCEDLERNFRLDPGNIQMNEALATGLSLPTNPVTSNLLGLGLGLGWGLGLPFLAALVGCLHFYLRLRRTAVSKPVYHGNGLGRYDQHRDWPKSNNMPPLTPPASDTRLTMVPEMMPMPIAQVAVPELGDTSAVTVSKVAADSFGAAVDDATRQRMEWEMMEDRERRELDSQAKWGGDNR